MSGAIPPPAYTPSCHGQGQLYISLPFQFELIWDIHVGVSEIKTFKVTKFGYVTVFAISDINKHEACCLLKVVVERNGSAHPD
jgi:hypothetical protein